MGKTPQERLPQGGHASVKETLDQWPGARIGLILRREELGMTRPDLGDKLGICRQYVFSIEIGKREPSFDLMIRWAAALDAPLTMFGLSEAQARADHARSMVERIFAEGSPKAIGTLEEALSDILAAA